MPDEGGMVNDQGATIDSAPPSLPLAQYVGERPGGNHAADDGLPVEGPPFALVDDHPLLSAVVNAIKQVYDPEIPVDVWELGLIYRIETDADQIVHIEMSLTSPMCPSAQDLPPAIEYRVCEVDGVRDCLVEVIWEPPWGPERMSEIARLRLDMF